MKRIKLVPGIAFRNNMSIEVYDMDCDTPRKRCSVTAEFARYDVEQLIKQGLDLDAAMASYEEWLRQTMRRHLLDEPEYVEGHDEVMSIIYDRISEYYKQ